MATGATEGIHIQQAVAAATASFMPVLDWDMTDLDVRDSQNRPTQDTSQNQGLTELFISNLFDLVVINNLHGIRHILMDLDLFSHLFNSLFFDLAYRFETAVLEALQPSSKRFVHNVYNLWISLSVGILLCRCAVTRFLSNLSLQKLVLRC